MLTSPRARGPLARLLPFLAVAVLVIGGGATAATIVARDRFWYAAYWDQSWDVEYYDTTGRLLPSVQRMGDRFARDLRQRDRDDLMSVVGVPERNDARGIDRLLELYGGDDVRLTSDDPSMPSLQYTVRCPDGSDHELSLPLEVRQYTVFDGALGAVRWYLMVGDGGYISADERCPGR